MRRIEAIKTLKTILRRKQSELEALQAAIDGLELAIREVAHYRDDFVTKPQERSARQEITAAIYDLLKANPQMHRKCILEGVTKRGIYVGGGLKTIGAYLSMDERFEPIGSGLWRLRDTAESTVSSEPSVSVPVLSPRISTEGAVNRFLNGHTAARH